MAKIARNNESNDFLSTFNDSFNVLNCCLSGVVNEFKPIKKSLCISSWSGFPMIVEAISCHDTKWSPATLRDLGRNQID